MADERGDAEFEGEADRHIDRHIDRNVDVDSDIDPAELDPAELDPAELDNAELDNAELDPAELDPAEEFYVIDTTNPDIIGTARRRYGGAGAALGAGMFGLDVALGNKKKPDSVQIQEAPSEPIDVDKSGIQVIIDDLTSVAAPALERREPVGLNKKKARRR